MPTDPTRLPPKVSSVSELYTRYAPSLRLFFRRQLRVKSKVDDILHDVFECLLRYPPSMRLVQPDHYLWRIAWRLVNANNRRVVRETRRMAQVAGEADDWVHGQSSPTTPEDISEWIAYQEQIQQSLGRLSVDERKAVIMARLGFPYKEIAARMDISVETLRNHLRRGYSALNTAVAETDQESAS